MRVLTLISLMGRHFACASQVTFAHAHTGVFLFPVCSAIFLSIYIMAFSPVHSCFATFIVASGPFMSAISHSKQL